MPDGYTGLSGEIVKDERVQSPYLYQQRVESRQPSWHSLAILSKLVSSLMFLYGSVVDIRTSVRVTRNHLNNLTLSFPFGITLLEPVVIELGVFNP